MLRSGKTCIAALSSVLALTLGLTACQSSPHLGNTDQGQEVNSDNQDSIAVHHAFGETTIHGTPHRVATVGWANQEVPLALGITPVGMPKATWGDDDNDGILPWVKEKLDAIGDEPPILFDETDSIDFEAVADSQPDVILAAYSGISQEDYDQLSQIAPTIAYPEVPWGATLDQIIDQNAAGLNQKEKGAELKNNVHQTIAGTFQKYPKLAAKKVIVSGDLGTDLSKMSFYVSHDPRMNFLEEAGFQAPAIVDKESETSDQFFKEISAEHADQFNDVDVFITYGSNDPAENHKVLERLQKHPLWSKVPAIAKGHVVFMGTGPQSAAVNPSPLSVEWGLDNYFHAINDTL